MSYIELGDEKHFLEFAENFIRDLNIQFRKKQALDHLHILETLAKLEDVVFNQALKEFAPLTNVWGKVIFTITYLKRRIKISF